MFVEKPSDSLFTLDTTGSTAIQTSYNKIHKPLKSDQILAQRSAIPALDSHKRPLGISDGVVEPKTKRRKTNGVSPREYERLKALARGTHSAQDVLNTDNVPDHDPWAVSNRREEKEDQRFSYLEKKKPVRAPLTLREAPVSLAATRGEIPALSTPRPGTSYNPVFEEWDTLLRAEGAKEVEAEKKRILEAEIDKARLERIAAAEKESDPGEFQTDDESAWEGFESDYSGAEWLKKKRPERKTPAERKKANRKKEAERKEKWEKKQQEREKQQRQLYEIIRKMKEEGKAKAQAPILALSEVGEADDKILRRRRFGKDEYGFTVRTFTATLLICYFRVPKPPLELVLPDELRDSLRLLKPEGNLLKDRFRNILVRGKMETRKPIQQPKKKRRTVTEKWSYKDFAIPT